MTQNLGRTGKKLGNVLFANSECVDLKAGPPNLKWWRFIYSKVTLDNSLSRINSPYASARITLALAKEHNKTGLHTKGRLL